MVRIDTTILYNSIIIYVLITIIKIQINVTFKCFIIINDY